MQGHGIRFAAFFINPRPASRRQIEKYARLKVMNSQIGLETCLRFVSSEGVSSGTHIKFSEGAEDMAWVNVAGKLGIKVVKVETRK